MTFPCGVMTQALFAYDVERFVIETILRRGSFDHAFIIPCRGSLRTFASYREFVRSKHRGLKIAVALPVTFENQCCAVAYTIRIIGMTSVRLIVLWFQDGVKVEPTIMRRTLAGLCLPWFDDVSDN